MDQTTKAYIEDIFLHYSGEKPLTITPFPASGSRRKYYRVQGKISSSVFAYNPDIKENETFFYLTEHFRKAGLNVPEIYYISDDRLSYLQQDLGDTTLFSLLTKRFENDHESMKLKLMEVMDQLTRFQFIASVDLDYSRCYPEMEFDKLSMMADLNYFRYCFLLPTGHVFNSRRLDEELSALVDYLYEPGKECFMYRDFQSRNIMMFGDTPYFIDYQGGRKGHYLYDVASLLFQAKAGLSPALRELLFNFYIEKASSFIDLNLVETRPRLHAYALLRLLQALGAYGYRGFFERKDHFLSSVPFALDTLAWLVEKGNLPVKSEELSRILIALHTNEYAPRKITGIADKLTVTINSFSYKSRIPFDSSGNGGGFVFDCRSLPNPGRYEEYAVFTGREKVIIDFLKDKSEIKQFKKNVFDLISEAVENYLERNFTSLVVNFGCTGGKHRSVYMAECLNEYLAGKYDIYTRISHTELEKQNIMKG